MYVGIDVGNCTISVSHPDPQGNPVVMMLQGQQFLLSEVYFAETGILFSEIARNSGILDPSRHVRGWKRSMATDDVLYKSPDGQEYKAKDIARILLEYVKENIEQQTGEIVDRVALSVPANAVDRQKHELKEAAEALGMKVVVMPHEPTAAIMSLNLDKKADGHIATLDLGGGTFDCTVCELHGDTVDIKNTNGEKELGGIDFNNRLIDMILDRFESEQKFRPNPTDHAVDFQDLYSKVENLKISLTFREKAPIVFMCEKKALSTEITRAQFKNQCKDLLEKAMGLTEKTLNEAGIKPEDCELVPVGGASLMPCFQEKIEERFGCKPSIHPDPLFAVSKGVTTIGILTVESEEGSFVLDDRPLPPIGRFLKEVTAHPIGICIVNRGEKEVNSVILAKGTRIPGEKTERFRLFEDGQTDAEILVLQGPDGAPADQCKQIGVFRLCDLSPVHGKPHIIEIKQRLDRSALFTAEAYDTVGGKTEQMEVKYDLKNRETTQ